MAVIAVVFVAAVLGGAKWLAERSANAPVTVAEVPAPLADSGECARVVESAPDELLGYDRAVIADPAPAGAVVWKNSGGRQITLRCGVEMPLQYTALSEIHEADGVEWLVVPDPGGVPDLATWYTVNRSPVVAVTGELDWRDSSNSPFTELDVSFLPVSPTEPHDVPLSSLDDGDTAACEQFLGALPATLAEEWTRRDQVPGVRPGTTAVWTHPAHSPIVVRCGVAFPSSYAPGAQLTQVNDVAWFVDEASQTDPGATTMYALTEEGDRRPIVAVSWPTAAGSGGLTTLSDAISKLSP